MSEKLREQREKTEHIIYAPNATFADTSKGRERDEAPCPIRTCFRRDIDRIVHSKAFRRLKRKTQVFVSPEGDHYRTRMTHTIEVMRIARTISSALLLNEDLAEAIAWGHDLGHTSFGHAGERALRNIVGHFEHNEQSLRVVDCLEKDGKGLNLTFEVRDGILNHPSKHTPSTPEGRVVQLSDRLAYVCHDIDDAIRGGIIQVDDIPVVDTVGRGYSQRLNTFVSDIIDYSSSNDIIDYSPDMRSVMKQFYDFLYDNVYTNPVVKSEESKVEGILARLHEYYLKRPEQLPDSLKPLIERDGEERVVTDYVAGMSDSFVINAYEQLFVPQKSLF